MKKLLFAATALTLAFTSCKKDNNGNPGNPDNPATAKLLKKVTKTEGAETTIYNLTYDGNKRLVSMTSADNAEYVKFTYDNNGNVTGAEELNNEFKNIFTYRYKANGQPEAGTFKSWRQVAGEPDEMVEDNIMNYTVANNQVTQITVDMVMAQQEIIFDLSYENGHLKKIQSANPAYPFTATFAFGSKKSAVPTVYKFALDYAGFSTQFSGKNELLTMSFDFGGMVPGTTVTNQYTYDAAGYPLTSTDGGATYKYEYQ